MGKFTEIQFQSVIERQLKTTQSEIEKNEEKLHKASDKVRDRAMAYMQLDQSRREQTIKLQNMALTIVAAPILTMVPIAGPTLAGALGAALSQRGQGTKNMLLAAAMTATTYNLTAKAKHPDNYFVSGTVVSEYREWLKGNYSLEGSVIGGLQGNMVKFSGLLLAAKNKTANKSTLLVPAKPKVIESSLKNYAATIEEGYQFILDDINKEPLYLIPLIFHKWMSSFDESGIGGKGQTLVKTGVGQLDDIFKKGFGSLSQLKAQLIALDKDTRRFGEKLSGSRLVTRLSKYKDSPYEQIFDTSKPEGQHMESSLALHKAKIIAYADDYIDKMSGRMSKQFLNYAYSNNKYNLPECFHPKNAGYTHAKSLIVEDPMSTKRKHFVLAMHAFHSILFAHLGTYNLGSLPPYGADPEVDSRVKNALIDAIATAVWIESKAYDTSSPTFDSDSIEYTNPSNAFQDKFTLTKIPYINAYFDSKRIWRAQGRSVITSILAQLDFKSAIRESKDLSQNLIKGLTEYYSHIDNEIKNLEKAFNEAKKQLVDELNKNPGENKEKIDEINALDLIGSISDNVGGDLKQVQEKHNLAVKQKSLFSLSSNLKLNDKITEFGVEGKARLYQFYNVGKQNPSYENITASSLYRLMPTNKPPSTAFLGVVRKVIESLYIKTYGFDPNSAIADMIGGMNEGLSTAFSQGALIHKKDKLYSERIKAQYNKLKEDKPDFNIKDSDTIKNKYKSLVGNPKGINRKEIDSELAEILSVIQMGAIVSASGDENFDQADFNRAISKAIKLMSMKIGAIPHE